MSRRRLACEPLEERRLLATLDLELQLYADDSGSRGDPIEYATVGDTFFLSVTANDLRSAGTPAGVIALPLDLQWRKDVISYRSDDPRPPEFPSSIPLPAPEEPIPNAVVTPDFLLQRFVNDFDVDDVSDVHARTILGLRGASLPAAGLGEAIGGLAPSPPTDTPYNEFSLIHFEAVGAGWAMPFKMRLAGSMSFADAAPLDGLADADANATNTVIRQVAVKAVASGVKYEDLNKDGIWQKGPDGLPNTDDQGEEPVRPRWGVRAYVDQNGDDLLQKAEYDAGPVPQDGLPDGTVTTGSDGTYELALDTGEPAAGESCPAGTPKKYIIVEVLKEDWLQSGPQTKVLDFDSDELGQFGYAITVEPCDPNGDFDGTPADQLNFGNWTTSGIKYEDRNADGEKNGLDSGQSGWTIAAFEDQDSSGTLTNGDTLYASDVTDGNGAYRLLLEPDQQYIIVEKVSDHPDWFESPDDDTILVNDGFDTAYGRYGYVVRLDSNQAGIGDFGNYRDGTKEGTKYEDMNADGERDVGDAGQNGWTITAFADVDRSGTLSADDTPYRSTVTAADGSYRLALKPGQQYIIVERVSDHPDWFESPDDGTTLVNKDFDADYGRYGYVVTLDSNETESGNDFGNYRIGTKRGTKYEDLNADGDRDAGDAGQSGWTIVAFADDGDGVLDGGDTLDASAVTDAAGAYRLTLKPGQQYVIVERVSDHPEWFESPDDGTTLVNNGFDTAYGRYGYVVTLDSNETESGNDFGNYRNGTKRGTKYEDLNRDGEQNGLDAGRSGWTIAAFEDKDSSGTLTNGDTLYASDATDDDGEYSLALKPGLQYIIVERLSEPPDWFESPDDDAALVNDGFNPAYASYGYVVKLESNETENDNDFGNWTWATVEGVKSEDRDADGQRDPDEDPLSGWVIFVDYNSDGEKDAGEPSAITDENGRYKILNVKPGTWPICEVVQDGWTNTDPEGRCHVRTLVSGGQHTNEDFGNRRANGSLSGFVYADVDKDAQRDVDQQGAPIELGVPKVKIALWRDGQVVKIDSTGPDGWYHFEDLEPGVYDIVQLTQPACFIDGSETLGMILPGGKSRGTAGADRFTGIAIGADEHGIDYNFGELGLKASCVNKSMALGSSNVRQATVYDPSQVTSAMVKGTEQGDTFVVTVEPTAIRVTVNSGIPQTFPVADVQVVSLDGLGGQDAITVTGSAADESAHFQPGYFAYRNEVCQAASDGAVACDWDWAIEAISFERVTARAGDSAAQDDGDLAVLRDSTAKDVLTATGGSASLDLSDQELGLLAFEGVRALSTRGGADESHVTKPLDFELRLLGGWTPG